LADNLAMPNTLRKLSREPLLHFLLAGLALFLLYGQVSDVAPAGDEEIVVTVGHIEHLTSLFLKTRQRLPTDAELNGLIDDFIVEEILYREAKSIGLDQNDTIVRRRLRQKMEFLFDDFSAVEPSDDELKQFLAEHPEQYRTDDRISFEHVYLKDGSRAKATTLLKELRSGTSGAAGNLIGLGLLPPRFGLSRKAEVSAQFGNSFTERLFSMETGSWMGPIESPFGVHLVYVEEVVAGRLPELDEVRGIVKRDWLSNRRADAEREILGRLRQKYTVTIEEPPPEES
jgi:parvulin-like peptidyl-prolyl cis-trans isomerase-like protein